MIVLQSIYYAYVRVTSKAGSEFSNFILGFWEQIKAKRKTKVDEKADIKKVWKLEAAVTPKSLENLNGIFYHYLKPW